MPHHGDTLAPRLASTAHMAYAIPRARYTSSTYLGDVLVCIHGTYSQPVPAHLVETIVHGMLECILKAQHTLDLHAAMRRPPHPPY
jgi:hypothetical protein